MLSKLAFKQLDGFRDHGLLFLRVGLGMMFVVHGWPKLVGGPEKWEKVGGAMATLGLDFAPQFWGFMAAITEVGGGLLLALGLMTRPVLIGLIFTMVVATWMHISKDSGFPKISHPLKTAIMFIGLFIMGPGKFSIDARLGLTEDEE